ncbi:hypothetical protein LIER_10783 [Lithospermum erythrorhizon]|uniref:Reverse transcriptase Ty1/copia-type domain-containing protein n=1 Tax=Lithospermum erythrorhizon TaxID=34254 RepID=A0AAV3PMC2_LITER
MDVKSSFLNSIVQEELYVGEPKGFIDVAHPHHNGYDRGGVDNTLFIKKEKNQLIFAQIYEYDIVFGRVSNQLVKQFIQQKELEFEMSMVGELKYFLGFQINQMEDNIFISQAKYAKNIVKNFGPETTKFKRTPIPTHVKFEYIRTELGLCVINK